jgi:peptidoglycan/xylan/chitin deacetylase (PgdA/CDA1 family)
MDKWDLIYYSRAYKLFKPFYSGIGHVLNFHRVGNGEDRIFTKDLMVSSGSLETTLNYFKSRKIDVVSLDECHARITARKRSRRFVAFTFDDGYGDNLTEALPVFEKFDAPFTVFLSTGFPDHTIVLWWYLLEDMVREQDEVSYVDGGQTYAYRTSSPEEKKDAFWKIRSHIIQSKREELLPRLKNIFRTDEEGLLNPTRQMALSWQQVVELDSHPLVTLGAHTVNHFALSKLPEEEVRSEILGSMERIRSKTGTPVEHLAYPFGILSTAGPREFRIARECGLKTAYTTESSNILKRHEGNLLALPRIEMTNGWDDQFFDLYVYGFTPFFHKLIR